MAISYNKLWKLLIDKGYNKTKLCEEAHISTNAMAKLGRNENVRVDVLVKICGVLNCSMDDILEIVPTHSQEEGILQ
ncbi:MAG: helix-turn-helix transcriptional regulator [Oscillospiraceae bacterium]|nr:helix-turn-helix transcriptional regulator [Oscillospiraceae bacterium]